MGKFGAREKLTLRNFFMAGLTVVVDERDCGLLRYRNLRGPQVFIERVDEPRRFDGLGDSPPWKVV